MSIDSTRRRQIIASLQEKDYRDAFVAAEISTTVPFQIREMRNARGWTQTQLADQTGQDQPTISKFEDPDYATFTITSLKRLASAFDVALAVRFVPFSELVDRTLLKESLVVPEYANDTRLLTTADEHPVVTIDQSTEGVKVFTTSVRDYYSSPTTGYVHTVDEPRVAATPADTRLAHIA